MPQEFYQKLEKLLKQDKRFLDQEGDLLKSNIIDVAYKADKQLVELLLSNKEFKDKFFSKIKDATVFNINDFVAFIQDKNFLADSYTKYQNKIGLNINGKFLKERDEVALVWPFKDCVLEGTMTKEDEKRKEIFFNEILAQDEIDKLLTPKVLTNWKRYSQKGEEKVKDLKRNENGAIRENLIIRGNNLLALHSLKQQFQNKIKLIYIDPPYNTGNDSFGYNDSFNHSTWLTFMKNRLKVARKLLMENGAIFVQIDENEQAYLKILCDEVFGRDNFRNSIIWKRSQNVSSINNIFRNAHDVVLFYTKGEDGMLKRLYKKHDKKYLSQYSHIDQKGQYRHAPLLVSGKRTGSTGSVWKGIDPNKFGRNGMHWVTTPENLEKLNAKSKIYWPKKGGQPMLKYYLDEAKGAQISDVWDDINLISPTSKESLSFTGQKPEELIQRILDSFTEPGDIILDFFLGSGTTSAVAHKMGRQYIGVEQLNYGEDDAANRLQNVIGRQRKAKGKMFDNIVFDQSGISKTVNWKGGGDFVYCELMKYNEQFVEKINKAKDTKKLLKIWQEMKEKSFLNYNVGIKKFDENINEFNKLTLNKQKHILFSLLNKNQLYVNLSEMEDEEFRVGKEDKKMNEEFYDNN